MRIAPPPLALAAALLLSAGLASAAEPIRPAKDPRPVDLEAPREPARPRISASLRHDLSPPLRLIRPVDGPVAPVAAEMHRPGPLPLREVPLRSSLGPSGDPLAQGPYAATGAMPAPLFSFDGVNNRNGVAPPDPNIDVGRSHVVQWTNFSYAVWNKQGALLFGPVDSSTIWSGFGERCQSNRRGDPVVNYDSLADRWVLTELAFVDPNDYHQCVAVSQTSDPTGAFYRYDFLVSTTNLNDYPKLGVWPDAYYVAINEFDGPTRAWRGQGALALERDAMLQGLPARMVQFNLFAVNSNYGGALPSDLDGPVPPPAGSPNYFIEMDDDAWWPAEDRLMVWKFHVDWSNPAASTFGLGGEPDFVVDLTAAGYPFDTDLCGYSGNCLPQLGAGGVDALSDRLMWRLAYRNYGTHESIVLNHTVDVDGADRAGVRWYEMRSPETSPVIHQAGTFSPDASNRWMASVAMDGAGDLAAGYSAGSAATYNGVRYAGRVPSDPPGDFGQAEAVLVAGGGAQTGTTRWGDYGALVVDPVDDCTYWYTMEYYSATSGNAWSTRIGAFRFDACRSCPLADAATLTVGKEAPGIRLDWGVPVAGGTFDVVEGDLGLLRGGSGFGGSTTACLANDLAAVGLHVDEPDPASGNGFWYLVRGSRGVCRGSYDDRSASQTAPRDAAIESAAAHCP